MGPVNLWGSPLRPSAILIAATLLVLPAANAAVAAGVPHNALVYRVDSVTARIKGHRLIITAKGAVRSGGWERPRLHVLPQKTAEADTVTVEFVATPPAEGAAVIQALLPVSAHASVGLPRYATTKVTVRAQSNQVTASIVRTK